MRFSIFKYQKILNYANILSIISVFLVFFWLYDSGNLLLNTIKNNYLKWIIAFIFSIISILLCALKFKITLKFCANQDLEYIDWLKIFSKSVLFNNLVPSSGLIYRAIYLKNNNNIKYSEYIGVSYLFAYIGLTTVYILLGIFFLFLNGVSASTLEIFLFLVFFITAAYLFPKALGKIKFKNHFIDDKFSKLLFIDIYLRKLKISKSSINLILIFSLSAIVDFLVYYLVLHAIYPEITGKLAVFIYIFYTLSWLIKLTPNNVGISEIVMGSLTALLGMGMSGGVILSIGLRLVNLLSSIFIPALFYLIYYLKIGNQLLSKFLNFNGVNSDRFK